MDARDCILTDAAMTAPESPFFEIPRAEWIAANRSAFAVWDAHPVNPGHALVVSRRQISDWWEATAGERSDMFELVDIVRAKIDDLHSPDGFNVGFNAGRAAGQTVDHLHLHIIPRYLGDVADPRGGVRHVIPARGNYLSEFVPRDIPTTSDLPEPGLEVTTPVLIDGQVRLLLPELVHHLRQVEFDRIDIVVSFIKMSGLNLLIGPLEDALERGARVRILTTDYLGLTEPAALVRLHDLIQDDPEAISVRLFHDPEVSFHPKAYLFYSAAGRAEAAFVGSSNLSGSGLDGGIEWNLLVGAIDELKQRFLALWLDHRSMSLSDELIASYEAAPSWVPEVVEVVDLPAQPPEPRPIQEEALRALAQTRTDGFRAGMVTMATGLGKTWLAAFDAVQAQAGRVLFIAHREEILKQSRDVFRRVNPEATMGLYFGEEKQPEADFVFATVQTLSGSLDRFPPATFDYVIVDEFHHAAAATYRKVLDHFAPQFLLGLTATPERMDGADLLSLCADNLVFHCDLVEGIRRNELVPFHYWGVPDPVDFEPIPWRNGRFDPEALERAIETQERAQSAFDEWQSHRGTRTLAFCASRHHSDFMSDFFLQRGVRCASVHSGSSSAPRHQSIDELRSGELEVIFTVDLFNEGLDVPDIDTVLLLRPTESPIVFLQQLGRGLRIHEGKDALAVIDFIGNHRSFLLKPRTLLSLGRREAPTTLQVLAALESKDFDLPDDCSVDYDLTVVEMLKALSRTSSRDAIEEYCRAYMEEEGLRPTAAQTFRAGHDPAVVTGTYASWFNFLRVIDLLGEREAAVVDAFGETLRAMQLESITKSYKLIAIRSLLHEGALRTGDDVANNADVSRRLLLADPRLARDVPLKEFPDLAAASQERWASYWRKWPIAHLTGTGPDGARTAKMFRLDGDRIVPTFVVDDDLGDAFDAMAAELIEYRLASYVLNKEKSTTRSWTCRLAYADGHPIIRLDRRQSPDLPTGNVDFIAEGTDYSGSFAKGAVAFATRADTAGNALPGLLRSWFGPSAGHPGTTHAVKFEQVDGTRLLRPDDSASTDLQIDYVPLFGDYTVACGPGAQQSWSDHAATEIPIRRQGDRHLTPSGYFVCFAKGDSMDGGPDPIKHGDPLLFEWITGGSARDYFDEPVIVETSGKSGVAGTLKVLRNEGGGYVLESNNQSVAPIHGEPNMRPVARLAKKLDQADINPLASRIGEQFKSTDVPALYGEVYNSGNWRSGHVSLKHYVILFVSLEKRADRTQYTEHFEGPDVFVWSSQLTTSPERKKGKEVLNALETGKSIELWMRRKGNDPAFTYLGRVIPISHEGSEPMLVKFRLLTPLTGELQSRLGFTSHDVGPKGL
jgi:superfamily II DNA or RNA helicase/diadenosine tetraphosphate (Ap4A) HIT family hydrolase/HKD family nuclease